MMHQCTVASCTFDHAARSTHGACENGLCREVKQASLAQWRAAREQEEQEITAQLVEQQELQKQVCIAAVTGPVVMPTYLANQKAGRNEMFMLLVGRSGCPSREAGCK